MNSKSTINVYAKEFVPCVQSSIGNQDLKNNYKSQGLYKNRGANMHKYPGKARVLNEVKQFIGFEKDKRRTFSKKQAIQIWEKSGIDPDFDSSVFRLDLFGNLVAKGIKYAKNSPSCKFAYDLEHVVSYSKNGMTDVGNGALLNSGANRSKGNVECYKINENEYSGLKGRFGIDPEDLYYQLENNLNRTCKKYNLLFVKKNNVWTLDKNGDNYTEYFSNQKYKNFPKNIDVKVDSSEEAAVIAAVAGAVGGVANFALGLCLEGYNIGYYFTREKLGYVDENKDTSLTETQKKIQTVGAVITSIGVGVAVASKIQEQKNDSRKNKKSIENL
jgi:hypothetical protein